MDRHVTERFQFVDFGSLLVEQIIGNLIGQRNFKRGIESLKGLGLNFSKGTQRRIFQGGSDPPAPAERTGGVTDFLDRGLLLLPGKFQHTKF